jgi:hypothetical protein
MTASGNKVVLPTSPAAGDSTHAPRRNIFVSKKRENVEMSTAIAIFAVCARPAAFLAAALGSVQADAAQAARNASLVWRRHMSAVLLSFELVDRGRGYCCGPANSGSCRCAGGPVRESVPRFDKSIAARKRRLEWSKSYSESSVQDSSLDRCGTRHCRASARADVGGRNAPVVCVGTFAGGQAAAVYGLVDGGLDCLQYSTLRASSAHQALVARRRRRRAKSVHVVERQFTPTSWLDLCCALRRVAKKSEAPAAFRAAPRPFLGDRCCIWIRSGRVELAAPSGISRLRVSYAW